MAYTNYAYIYEKYFKPEGATVIVHDRTYDGLEVIGAVKPPKEILEATAIEDARVTTGVAQVYAREQESELQKKQEQARAEAERAAIPLEEKIKAEWAKIMEEVIELRKAAVEAQQAHRTKDALLDSWYEVQAAQLAINEEAEAYLKETDWYVTRKLETGIEIPVDIQDRRTEARARIDRGQKVFAKYDALRRMELPTREEIKKAIHAGGHELERIRLLCNETKLKYAKPHRR